MCLQRHRLTALRRDQLRRDRTFATGNAAGQAYNPHGAIARGTQNMWSAKKENTKSPLCTVGRHLHQVRVQHDLWRRRERATPFRLALRGPKPHLLARCRRHCDPRSKSGSMPRHQTLQQPIQTFSFGVVFAPYPCVDAHHDPFSSFLVDDDDTSVANAGLVQGRDNANRCSSNTPVAIIPRGGDELQCCSPLPDVPAVRDGRPDEFEDGCCLASVHWRFSS